MMFFIILIILLIKKFQIFHFLLQILLSNFVGNLVLSKVNFRNNIFSSTLIIYLLKSTFNIFLCLLTILSNIREFSLLQNVFSLLMF